ncbi:glycoside hydrolase family 95 protein [Persicirhabdus sediminis]|uniref:Glycoside hydrolase family 95 protein n=1 Tax=Persicirhabdus sediminis TaxID=454144 RepID=A0A8J7MEP2_9BACT|nr:glycoside hydrolase family 95 protein [Persicirhabdus sediminis]MBK1791128.1 glycoside hydrolase family 95 protein [Persicirhabdus sediminis]
MKSCLFYTLLLSVSASTFTHANEHIIWHDKEAGPLPSPINNNKAGDSSWLRAFPIGNGSLGGMVYGNVANDAVWINHDTFYALEPETACYIPDIRETRREVEANIAKGDYGANDKLISKLNGRSNAPYVSIGTLNMQLDHGSADLSKVSHYRKQLDMQTGVVTISYQLDGVDYQREYFASAPDQAIVVRFTASKPAMISGSFGLQTLHEPTSSWQADATELLMHGQGPGEAYRRKLSTSGARGPIGNEFKYPAFFEKSDDGYKLRYGKNENVLYADKVDGRGMFYSSRIKLQPEGGTTGIDGNQLTIKGANSLTLILTSDTSFNGIHKSPSREGRDSNASTANLLASASQYNYAELKKRHIADYQALYNRLSISIGEPKEKSSSIPTDQRIANYKKDNDLGLISLFYQFSRYLAIAGSREGSQPLNLQGIWSRRVIPAWNGGYTNNINAEMNYWNMERANLAECHEPFLRAILEAQANGEKVAKEMFGYSGWCMHHNTSIWRSCAPVDGDSKASFWPMGAGWYLQHAWEHYQFSGDKEFLANYYPALEGAAEFFTQWLTEGDDGYLLTPFGVSPEQQFIYGDGKKRGTLSPGCTMDMSIIRETFTNLLSATEILAKPDSEVVTTVRQQLPKLQPLQIGSEGQLQEWYKDFADGQKTHRHISHLYGYFPGQEITNDRPELVEAVRRSMERRGNGATGWSMGWKLCVWARMGDGENFTELMNNLMTPKRIANNMFDLHPPFQIDGNFGAARGIAECLIHDHEGEVVLLPTMPAGWEKQGEVSGMRVKGNHELDFAWQDGQLTKLIVRSQSGQSLSLRCGEKTATLTPELGKAVDALSQLK